MLTIECTLHGSLEDNLPQGGEDNRIKLHFDKSPSVIEVLARLNIDLEYLQFALADGQYIEFEGWNKPIQGQALQLWPRISGG